jgi:hypothetical protein
MIAALFRKGDRNRLIARRTRSDFVFGRPLPSEGDVVPNALMNVIERHLHDYIQKSDAGRDPCVAAVDEHYSARRQRSEQSIADRLRDAPCVLFHRHHLSTLIR